jgi:predicted metal-dependent phosphotriesterase family hydrolase
VQKNLKINNILELLQKYPEAAKVVKSYYLEVMLSTLNDDSLPEDFKEHVREMGIDDDKISRILNGSPRSMFDVFDDNGIFINITFDHEHRVFRYSVEGEVDSQDYLFRKSAEQEAIAEAFKILNERLCQTQS